MSHRANGHGDFGSIVYHLDWRKIPMYGLDKIQRLRLNDPEYMAAAHRRATATMRMKRDKVSLAPVSFTKI